MRIESLLNECLEACFFFYDQNPSQMGDVLRCDVVEVIRHKLDACVRNIVYFEDIIGGEGKATEETLWTSGLGPMLSV